MQPSIQEWLLIETSEADEVEIASYEDGVDESSDALKGTRHKCILDAWTAFARVHGTTIALKFEGATKAKKHNAVIELRSPTGSEKRIRTTDNIPNDIWTIFPLPASYVGKGSRLIVDMIFDEKFLSEGHRAADPHCTMVIKL